MARKKSGYGAACYYAGKMVGRCTVADGEAYTALMEQCGGNAARVLREYAYFSPELKAILENVAVMQAAKSRAENPPGLFAEPKISPWGKVQTCDTLCPGVFLVSTASHGGTMVSKEVAAFLSPAAKKCGFRQGGYLCFEEDCDAQVALRELMDKKMIQAPVNERFGPGAYEAVINSSVQIHHPEYWQAREKAISEQKRQAKKKGRER